MSSIFSFILDAVKDMVDWVLELLPKSPIQEMLSRMERPAWLGVLNWFVPVGTIMAIGTIWLMAVGLYYLYQVILRWIKLVGS